MRIWNRLLPLIFPGSPIEYREARKIHVAEIRTYRSRLQYVAGVCLFFSPLIYLFVTRNDSTTRIVVVMVVAGEICIRDTISEHYCLVLHRLGYRRPDDA